MGFWKDAGCLIGMHSYDDWHDSLENKCIQLRKCSNCNDIETKDNHTWNNWQYLIQDDWQKYRNVLLKLY